MVRKWVPDTQFNRGAIVRFNNLLYRSSVSHASGPGREVGIFQPDFWCLLSQPSEAPQLWTAQTDSAPATPATPEHPPMYVHPESGASTATVNSIPGYGFYTFLPAGHHPAQYHLPSGYRPLYTPSPYLHAPKPQHPIRPPDPDVKIPPHAPRERSPDYIPMPFPFSRFIESPSHPAYRTLAHAVQALEANEGVLCAEMQGESDAVCCVGGYGLWAYRHNEPGEAVKRRVYADRESDDDAGRETWLKAARARTKRYYQPGAIRPAMRWVLVEPRPEAENMSQAVLERHALHYGSFPRIPHDALQTGTESSGDGLCSARAWHSGGVHLGKAGKHLQAGGASLSYGAIEHELSVFEVLVGDATRARWVDASRLALELAAGTVPIEGGREAHGGPMLVAQAPYDGGWHPGKAAVGEDHACVGFGGGEFWARGFRVLVWADDAAEL